MIATISADIVRSTSLPKEDRTALCNNLRGVIAYLEKTCPGFRGRIVRGDGMECLVTEYRQVLRMAMLIKLFVKVQVAGMACHDLLRQHGIRFSIGMGEDDGAGSREDVMDSPVLSLSDRNLEKMSGTNLYTAFEMDHAPQFVNHMLGSYVAMLGNFVDLYSAQQSELVFYKLQGRNEEEIGERIGMTPSSVTSQLQGTQWGLLRTALKDFEIIDFKKMYSNT